MIKDEVKIEIQRMSHKMALCMTIVSISSIVLGLITATYFHNMDFLNDSMWVLPSTLFLSILCLLALDEYSMNRRLMEQMLKRRNENINNSTTSRR
jgi:hypothetical protein